jgi:hypothetical protein
MRSTRPDSNSAASWIDDSQALNQVESASIASTEPYPRLQSRFAAKPLAGGIVH